MAMSPSIAGYPARLRDLAAVPGLAGHEDAIIRVMVDRLAAHTDHVHVDALGNVIARLGIGRADWRVAVVAHMDTVGLLVKRFNPDGTLGVVPVGGVNLKALPGAAVVVGEVPGVIGVRSQHLARPGDEVTSADDLYIQVDPALISRVEITTPITYAPRPVQLGTHLYSSPYLDNRAGCAVLLDLAATLASTPPLGHVYLVATVQEETTCAGAIAALRAVEPDAAYVIDGTVSYDTPETVGQGVVRLGDGPVLTSFLSVSGLNGWHAHPMLRARLKDIARAVGIPIQQDAVRGLMSDARALTWLGIPSALVGLPMRGKHAPLETVHLADLAYASQLLYETLQRPLPNLARG